MRNTITRITLGLLTLVGLLVLPSCGSQNRTERPEAFTGQTGYQHSDTDGAKPRPAKLNYKGLHGPP
ncbi:MAG TPA: hypothetical protein PL151_15700 [Phycisphaerae bacterium]|nr:hypothetical protein [Phycisphaerae bacterium]HOJ72709.1 hypothetical protein [Phycisphaerae bacterium]HOM53681.1 hypothetical protein [Phycisphaerae bacterium]HOQ86985.1 hypothetical protein [Phycisphaerae bacterium]HPP24868.1 hypothetical protein [Phycisphaerae bacterium]